jgi:hypothetical protein
MKKVCSKCFVEKEFSEFYRKKTGKFGLCATCKKCVIQEATEWHRKNPEKTNAAKKKYIESIKGTEKYRERNRIFTSRYRNKNHEKCLNRERKRIETLKKSGLYDQDGANRRLMKWRQKHPEKNKCHYTIANALISGKMTKPGNCMICGKVSRIEGHHEDYSKPFQVIWVCGSCHRSLDKERRVRHGENK